MFTCVLVLCAQASRASTRWARWSVQRSSRLRARPVRARLPALERHAAAEHNVRRYEALLIAKLAALHARAAASNANAHANEVRLQQQLRANGNNNNTCGFANIGGGGCMSTLHTMNACPYNDVECAECARCARCQFYSEYATTSNVCCRSSSSSSPHSPSRLAAVAAAADTSADAPAAERHDWHADQYARAAGAGQRGRRRRWGPAAGEREDLADGRGGRQRQQRRLWQRRLAGRGGGGGGGGRRGRATADAHSGGAPRVPGAGGRALRAERQGREQSESRVGALYQNLRSPTGTIPIPIAGSDLSAPPPPPGAMSGNAKSASLNGTGALSESQSAAATSTFSDSTCGAIDRTNANAATRTATLLRRLIGRGVGCSATTCAAHCSGRRRRWRRARLAAVAPTRFLTAHATLYPPPLSRSRSASWPSGSSSAASRGAARACWWPPRRCSLACAECSCRRARRAPAAATSGRSARRRRIRGLPQAPVCAAAAAAAAGPFSSELTSTRLV